MGEFDQRKLWIDTYGCKSWCYTKCVPVPRKSRREEDVVLTKNWHRLSDTDCQMGSMGMSGCYTIVRSTQYFTNSTSATYDTNRDFLTSDQNGVKFDVDD